MNIGIGTYSFGGIESFLGLGLTLLEKFKKIKELGYDSVELLADDLMGNSVEDLKAWLDEAGIVATSVHAKPTLDVVQKLAAIGGRAAIWPSANFNIKAEALETAAELEAMAEAAEPYGIMVGYHNHEKEFFFDEGKTLLEHILDNTSKCYVQLDCGWAQFGGMYPPYFIRKYKNRIAAIHVKENSKVNGPGPRPASRYDVQDNSMMKKFMEIKDLPIDERKAAFEEIQKKMSALAGLDTRTAVQCPMGAPESNISWTDIKAALDEQDFDAFWVVEREHFYTDHDQCLAEDCAWLREHVAK